MSVVHHTGVTIDVAVGIAVVTGTITFIVGVLAGALVYHCISFSMHKHQSKFKPSHQQQQTDQENEEVPATNGKERLELRENIADEHV